MKRRLLLTAMLGMAFLAGCTDTTPPSTAKEPVTLSEATLNRATGFEVGQQLSTRKVYVFYDMQCPHCGDLWEYAKPLQGQVRFVWVPVALLNKASMAQGASVLAAKNPEAAMNEHEASMRQRAGGMTADSSAKDKFGPAVQLNTDILIGLGSQSVPFIVAQDPSTGAYRTKEGALPTEQLRAFLGV